LLFLQNITTFFKQKIKTIHNKQNNTTLQKLTKNINNYQKDTINPHKQTLNVLTLNNHGNIR